MSPSFGDILQRNKGFGPGFDFARVFLAVCVLTWHVALTAYGTYGAMVGRGIWIANYAILPMFFGLSGFLVTGSAQRLDLANFAINRCLRILPALAVEIVLSALVIGPLFTTFSLHRYFSRPEFFTYFLNVVGFIHYRLPGVFTANPLPFTVNGSLWTVPFEIMCYFSMALMVVTGFVQRGARLILAGAALVAASVLLQAAAALLPHVPALSLVLAAYEHGGRGPALVPCFLLGAATYALRDRIPYDPRLFLACVALTATIGFLASPALWEFTPTTFLICPLMIYMVCFIGLTRVPKLPYFARGDYSYGIYLYAFPIQQSLVALFPALRRLPLAHWAASVVLATLFATFSWHLIEKPILGLRKRFSFAARLEKERHR
jgi:peptidoglycan/LPS O-acetylase OafA/YrhL